MRVLLVEDDLKIASFIIKAQSDLDCDGIYSSITQKGFISQKTGQPVLSPLQSKNVLE